MPIGRIGRWGRSRPPAEASGLGTGGWGEGEWDRVAGEDFDKRRGKMAGPGHSSRPAVAAPGKDKVGSVG